MTDDDTNHLPPSRCPTCGYTMDAATAAFGANAAPRPHDLTVCMGCGELFAFKDDLTVRQLDLNDMLTLPSEAKIQMLRVQKAIRRLRPLTMKRPKP